MLYALIMAGGTGTRLWPMSRKTMPKQCLALTGSDTLVQMAVERISGAVPPERTLVITNTVQIDVLRNQLPKLPPENIIAEPCARGSATCIGLGAIFIRKKAPDAAMIVLSADHVIAPIDRFIGCVKVAERVAVERKPLVVFGIRPAGPSPEFGYIHRGGRTSPGNAAPVYRVAEFKEKPDPATAKAFIDSGEYYWNSGMFVWTVRTILDAIGQYMPALRRALGAMSAAIGTDGQYETFAEQYEPLAGQTIDYGVMERAAAVEVVEADFDWDDVGTWPAVAKYHEADSDGNTITGEAELIGAKNCLIHAGPGHMIGAIGVEDLVIIQTPDATLVCHRSQAGKVRELGDKLKQQGKTAWL